MNLFQAVEGIDRKEQALAEENHTPLSEPFSGFETCDDQITAESITHAKNYMTLDRGCVLESCNCL